MADSVRTPIELHLFSDMQKSAMPASFAELALPANVSLVLHPVAKDAVPNWTVESVNAPGQVWDPKKTRVQAVIAGYHTPAATRTVSLVVNGKTARDAQRGRAREWARHAWNSIRSTCRMVSAAARCGSIRPTPCRPTTQPVSPSSAPTRGASSSFTSRTTPSPLYFGSALAAAAEAAFTVESVTVEQAANVDPSQYAFVVLSDVLSLPASFEDSLARYVRGGGSVLVAAGTSGRASPRVPVFGEKHSGHALLLAAMAQRFLTVGDVDPSYPVDREGRPLGGREILLCGARGSPASRVVAKLTDQTPLLLEKKIGEGRVLLFTSGLDNLTNDFPLHPRLCAVRRADGALSFRHRRSAAARAWWIRSSNCARRRSRPSASKWSIPTDAVRFRCKEAASAQIVSADARRLLPASPRRMAGRI